MRAIALIIGLMLLPAKAQSAYYGTISAVSGAIFTMTNKSGQSVKVDATAAVVNYMAIQLYVGENVLVTGDIANGAVVATAVIHAKQPSTWPN